jgi:HAD superfamily hydrolase (TIGR01509 family)
MSARAVVFDFDGVIIDSMSTLIASWSEEFERYGATFDDAAVLVCTLMADQAHDPYEWLAARAQDHFDADECRSRRHAREHELVRRQEALPGVVECLKLVRDQGLPIAIASGSSREWVLGHLHRLELDTYFDVVCCAEDVTRGKPAPDLYLLAAQRLSVEPSNCLAVEDSLVGLRAAQAAGCRCVVVANPITKNQEFRQPHVLLEYLNVDELGALISGTPAT